MLFRWSESKIFQCKVENLKELWLFSRGSLEFFDFFYKVFMFALKCFIVRSIRSEKVHKTAYFYSTPCTNKRSFLTISPTGSYIKDARSRGGSTKSVQLHVTPGSEAKCGRPHSWPYFDKKRIFHLICHNFDHILDNCKLESISMFSYIPNMQCKNT